MMFMNEQCLFCITECIRVLGKTNRFNDMYSYTRQGNFAAHKK